MLKAILIWHLVLIVLGVFGYMNYRQTCRSAENLMRLFRRNED